MTIFADMDNRLALCEAMAGMIATACDKISDRDDAALAPMYVADNIKVQIQQARLQLDEIEEKASTKAG